MSATDKQRLTHILEACRLIIKHADRSRRLDFEADEILIEGLIRQLEKIGEASKHLSAELRSELHMIPWKDFMRTRDRLTHRYFEVDYAVVWRVMMEEVPILHDVISLRYPDIAESL